MFGKTRTEVLVVGAGPVGLFAALLLAKRDIDVTIIDQERRTNVHSYALALHPRSLGYLSEAGLLDRLEDTGYRIRRIGLYEGDTCHGVMDLGKLETSQRHCLVIPQSILEAALEDALNAMGVHVRWNHRLEALDVEDGVLKTKVAKLDDVPQGYPALQMRRLVSKTLTIESQYVIGADGYHSVVRQLAGIPIHRIGAERTFSVYEFETALNLDHELRIVWHGDKLGFLWPVPGGLARWSFERDASVMHDGTAAALRALLDVRAPWFLPAPEELLWTADISFERRVAERFGQGHVWLAGDSAHLTEPGGCQSMNSGLIEAHDLAWRLYDVLRSNASPNLLEVYNRDRVKDWLHLTGAEGRIVALGDATAWIRERGDRLRANIPALGRDLEGLMLQVGLEPV